MSVTSWFLVSSSGTRHRLPREMIFVGREECELMLQSRSVDKQHAVINYDPNMDEHMVKDLGSLNGTFVNDLRIPDQTYITLKLSDVIRFGYDAHVYMLEKSQHKVPEEALKHEKYTSQLQLSMKALEARKKEKKQGQNPEKSRDPESSQAKLQDRAERKAHSVTVTTDCQISKPTPLYGQPSWWGEDEEPKNKEENDDGKQPDQESSEPAKEVYRHEINGSLSDSQGKTISSYRREPSYFEIPTKEFQQHIAKKPQADVQEVPTKDTLDPSLCVPSTPTSVVQSHASFTIEFDDCTPGKMKIKDHVTKFSFRQQRKPTSKEAMTTPSEVMSAESKVADWLVQSNRSMMRRRSTTEDMYSIKSDQSIQRTTKGHHHEDGTHSDSEEPAVKGKDVQPPIAFQGSETSQRAFPPRLFSSHGFTSPDSEEPRTCSTPETQSPPSLGKADPHQAFVIEFFNDNPRKKRSQSFTNNMTQPDTSVHRAQLEKIRKGSGPSGEKQVPSSASSTPPSQRYTIPLKGSGSPGHQRAGSLRREKTEDRISTGFSSRSSSSVSIRPFGSVGRRSKLAQDFTAEFLKQAKQAFTTSREKSPSSSPTSNSSGTTTTSQSHHSPASPPLSTVPHLVQTSSPVHQPMPLKAPLMPQASQSAEVKSPRYGPKNEEEDSLSDAGTYTIEADAQDKELEEARRKIDQASGLHTSSSLVFGVVESPEQTNQNEAETSAAYRPVIVKGREQHRQSNCGELRTAPGQGESRVKVNLGGPVLQGAPKWMSRWASLADSYTDSGPSCGFFDIPSQMELPGGGGKINRKTTLGQNQDSAESESSRTRRILPQVPPGEKSEIQTPSIHVHYDLQSTFDILDSSSLDPRSQDVLQRLTVQDDVEPDSLSDASKSDDGSILEQRMRPLSDTSEKNKEEKPRLPAKSTSFYIGSDETVAKPECGGSKPSTPKTERKQPSKNFSTATLTRPRSSQDSGKVKPNASAPLLGQGAETLESKECLVNTLVRQESFTKDRPIDARLPNISSLPTQKDTDTFQGVCSQDTHTYLKQTEDVLAALEAKLQAGQPGISPSPVMDSLSGDSDVDTSSTVSQHSNKTKPNTLSKKPSITSLRREKSSAGIASQDSNRKSSAYERLTENRRTHDGITSKNDLSRRPVGLRRSIGKRGSTDLSDDPQSSSLPYSDQESGTRQPRKKYTTPLQKEDPKTSKASHVLSRSNSLSAPRPTRASMLRRARLGEASDNEGTETDRISQEVGSASTKQPQEAKKLSRLDMLAMPRKRTSSFNTPSDTEAASTGRSTGFSNRSTESSSSSARKASVPVPGAPPQKGALNRTPITRGRSSSAKYTSSTASSRRRQKGSDYTSTSEEEYDSNQSTPKHKRSQPSPASHNLQSQSRPQPLVALRPKPRGRDYSEDESHEGDAFQNWSSHSAEIARLSQDLAKDLAILAREIHDVAGDADPQSSRMETNAPASKGTAHEELVQHLPEVGLNYPRALPGSAEQKQLDQISNWDTEEPTVDRLMLNPVTQVSMAIRENTEQLTDKIKLLFQDKMDVWEEIEAKINSENDVPILKTSNKEIASILKELRRVQRQLEVINTIIEPPPVVVTSSTGVRPSKPPSRDWRTIHSVSHRGGGPRPSESVRRAAVTPDDSREGYLV
ncbi:centrosomal protein of 170 kDa protein B [Lampris incognitus]|uniref:centrosomal protein of 170 kDa protein B n=1 Tax=Lampris incognitus TaxID=2546036 RepID=UPI0024B5D417|nr:centrosomal protein of 170 kDa protein B [Lampris incognitus]